MAQQSKPKARTSSGSRSNRRTSANGRKAAKPRSSASRANRRTSANGRTAAKSRSSASRAQSARTPKRGSGSSRSNQKGAFDAAKDATANRATAAGSAVTSAATKLKTPLIAAGTGLAGAAAGIALTRNKNKGISNILSPSPFGAGRATRKGLGEAAKNIGMLAERTGKVAEQVRVASEAIGEGSAPRASKSPIEVVVEGLTNRRQSRAG
jgi:hypothetical protein